MATAVASISDFALNSTWRNSGGAIVSGPTTVTISKNFEISGIPEGADIQGAQLRATLGSPLTGYRVLQINGQNVAIGAQTVEVTPLSGGNGTYAITFVFQAGGSASMSDGTHSASVTVTGAALTVTYADEPPAPPEPEPDAAPDWIPPVSVFPQDAEKFANNGLAVLFPLEGSELHCVAGGDYSVQLQFPLDPAGKWRLIQPESLIRVPVPTETIENAWIGIEVDLYRVTRSAALREWPQEPQTITYPAWSPDDNYAIGDRVTDTIADRNYRCVYFDETSALKNVPPSSSDWWNEVPRYISGAPVLVQCATGDQLYFVEDAGAGWYKMSTPMGIEGYIRADAVTFVRHITPEESQERTIRNQLFRVKNAVVSTTENVLDVYAVHVSYDLGGILIRDANIAQAAPAMAITRIVDGLMMPYRGQIATNLSTDENGTYTGSLNGKNGIFAFLDPSAGMVATFDARLMRDNWDLFVLQRTNKKSGVRLEYGKNLNGVTWSRSSENLILYVVPVAKDAQGADYYLPGYWVASDHAGRYKAPRMERLPVKGQIGKDDGTGIGTAWTADTLAAEMEKKARERFTVDHVDEIAVEVSVNVELLGNSVEYAWLRPLQRVNLYDVITCHVPDIGLDVDLSVIEIRWDIVHRRIKSLKASTNRKYTAPTVAGYNIGNNSIETSKLTESAIQEIANLIN